MTSSLVGSEMCIRDSRPSSCVPTATRAREQKRWWRSPNIFMPRDGQEKNCLLYTSDAADDM
eukprot:1309185-Prorocentrum_lima.AAC.1